MESDYDCIFYGIKPKDSIKRLEGGSCKVEERDNFILVQTPQICESKKLKNALEVLTSKNIYPTDESSAMENSGYSVNFIEGSQKNIKITFQEDLVKEDILIGNGFDLHRFCKKNIHIYLFSVTDVITARACSFPIVPIFSIVEPFKPILLESIEKISDKDFMI